MIKRFGVRIIFCDMDFHGMKCAVIFQRLESLFPSLCRVMAPLMLLIDPSIREHITNVMHGKIKSHHPYDNIIALYRISFAVSMDRRISRL